MAVDYGLFALRARHAGSEAAVAEGVRHQRQEAQVIEVYMPKMSDHMTFGEIVSWAVGEGDFVVEGQVLLEVQSDKAIVDLEAPASGVVKGIRAGTRVGAAVPVGETIAFIAEPEERVPALPALSAVPPDGPRGGPGAEAGLRTRTYGPVRGAPYTEPAESRALVGARPASSADRAGKLRAAPAARRLAGELAIDLSQIEGTGPQGQIRAEDVRAFAGRQPHVSSLRIRRERPNAGGRPSSGGEEVAPAASTTRLMILGIDADVTQVLSLRKTLADTGQYPSITAILVMVVARALREHPGLNASFANGRLRWHDAVNIGLTVETTETEVSVVIRDADRRSLMDISREVADLQEKTQQTLLRSEEVPGSTFIISSLGEYGIDRLIAPLVSPQCAVLGVGRIIKTPVGMADDTIALRPRMSLSLTLDGLYLDGLDGARFLARVRELLEEPLLLYTGGETR